MRISDWSSDVCSSDLEARDPAAMGALYSSDAVIWHSNDDLALTLERHLTTFIQNTSAIDSFSYKDVKVHPFVGGFVQQHRTQGKMKSGQEFERSEEHTSELQSLMRISYAVFCLKKKKSERQLRLKQKKTRSKNKN